MAFLVVIVFSILYFLGSITWSSLQGTLIATIPFLLALYWLLLKGKKQAAILALTATYLLEEEDRIDDLLGIFISGRYRKVKIDPLEEFFKSLNRISRECKNYETKRRLSEALPALYILNLDKSKETAKILRTDWDRKRKSDNRRRVVESFCYLIKKDKKFIRENIHLIEGDEIYCALAIVEIISLWRKYNKRKANKIFLEFLNEVKGQKYGKEELEAIRILWNLLEIIHKDLYKGLLKTMELTNTTNVFIQIGLIRNIKYFCSRFPRKTLDIIRYFQKSYHKNVRRVIAKDDVLESLIRLLENKETSEQAKQVITKLIKDEDDSIRFASFDRIERIFMINNNFGKYLMDYVERKKRDPKLIERSCNIRKRLNII